MKDRCSECSGFGSTTVAHDTGVIGTGYFEEELCPYCDGEGETDVLCPCCDNPVDDQGWCASCSEATVWVQLTEVHGDPLLNKRRAA